MAATDHFLKTWKDKKLLYVKNGALSIVLVVALKKTIPNFHKYQKFAFKVEIIYIEPLPICSPI